MRAYLTPLWQTDDAIRRIELVEGDRIGVYRGSDGLTLYAETPDGSVDLGVQDPTVSRKKGGEPPVAFRSVDRAVEVSNHQSATNDLTVRTGLGEGSVSPGEVERISDSCEVDIGFNATVRLTIESDESRTLDVEEVERLVAASPSTVAGSDDGGISRAAYVDSVATNLRKASSDGPNECLKYANDLHNFVRENPLDVAGYEATAAELERLVEKLETKVSADALRSGTLDEEQRDQVDRIAHRTSALYTGSK
jgi:hypothetical protein